MQSLWIAVRAIIWASGLFVLGVWGGIELIAVNRGMRLHLPKSLQLTGMIIAVLGAVLAVWCVATFVARGHGTPAPFDPPRRFVVYGPYRYVRNPMYIGGLSLVIGWALLARAPLLLAYALVLFLCVHAFVRLYEEPTLRRKFGAEYENYLAHVHRWLPRLHPYSPALAKASAG